MAGLKFFSTLKVSFFIFVFFFIEWLMNMTVQKLVVVIKDVDTSEVVERWQFDVECDKTFTESRFKVQINPYPDYLQVF